MRRYRRCGASVEPDGTVRGMDFVGTCSACGQRLSLSGGAHVPDSEPALSANPWANALVRFVPS